MVAVVERVRRMCGRGMVRGVDLAPMVATL